MTTTTLKRLRYDEIHMSPHNLRLDPSGPDIIDLAHSILGVGLLEPMIVRKNGEGYELIAGHRRLIAIGHLRQVKKVEADATWDCIVRSGVDDATATASMIVENLHRVDLTPAEQYNGLVRLTNEHGWTVKQIAQATGISLNTVKDRLNWASIPADQVSRVLDLVGVGATTELSKLPADRIAKLTAKSTLSKWDVEDTVRKYEREKTTAAFLSELRKRGHIIIEIDTGNTYKESERVAEHAEAGPIVAALKAATTETHIHARSYLSEFTVAKLDEYDLPVPAVFEVAKGHGSIYVHRLVTRSTFGGPAVEVEASDYTRAVQAARQDAEQARQAWQADKERARVTWLRGSKPAELIATILWDIVNDVLDDTDTVKSLLLDDDDETPALDWAAKSAANLARVAAACTVQTWNESAYKFDTPQPEMVPVNRAHYDEAGKKLTAKQIAKSEAFAAEIAAQIAKAHAVEDETADMEPSYPDDETDDGLSWGDDESED